MNYGDIRAGQTVRCRFNTVNTSGVPTTLTSGAVTVSRDGSDVTPSGGVTLTADVGSVTGRHHVVIDTSVDATTFTAGSEYAVRLSGSSAVGGTSVVGIVVGEWSIANRAVAVDSSGRVTLAAVTHTGAVIPTVTTTATATNLTNLPAVPTDWLTAAGVKADAVTKIQAGLATPTNITAGTITTVTTLTNLPSAPTDWIAAASVSAAAVTKIQAGLSVYAGGDTTGTTILLSRIPGTVQPQTGDAYARIGAAGAGLTAVGDARLANLDAAVTTRLATAGYTAPPAAATVAIAAWDLATSGHTAAGTFGAAMAAAGTAGDPWSTVIPGSYATGTAGAKLGGTLDANVVTVLGGTPVPADLNNVGLKPTGLDQVSMAPEPGVPTTFRGLLVWVSRRFYRSAKTPTALTVLSDAGATLTTQAVSDDGQGTESISAPS